jgi:hypothetical protein
VKVGERQVAGGQCSFQTSPGAGAWLANDERLGAQCDELILKSLALTAAMPGSLKIENER